MLSRLGHALIAALVAVPLTGCVGVDLDSRGSRPISTQLVALMTSKGMTPANPIVIRLYKQESELEIWKRDRSGRYALLKTYPICRWSGKLGPKTVEGDRQAPEGFYEVASSQLNPQSQFYLSFNLGYPNRLEQGLGYSGSALMVHGACTSAGCFAMTDDGAAEIYAVAREALAGGQGAFQVQALPFRMTRRNLASHRQDRNLAFWLNLKQGTDLFDASGLPPVVGSCGRRYAFAAAGGAVPSDPLAACPPATPDGVADMTAYSSEPEVPASLPYRDGGMHVSFRKLLTTLGPERLSKMTSANNQISQPDAALADPYQP